MRKLTSALFLITFFVSLLILGRIVTISAQPQGEDNNLVQEDYQPSSDPGDLDDTTALTSTNAYTIYLPIVIKDPRNPKKGVAVIASPACADMDALRGSWYLNWTPLPDATCGGVDQRFVPRIGNAAAMVSLSVAISNAQASGWLIGFNEPDLVTQANMTPAQGAILWKQIEDAAIPAGIKLVSPAPSQVNPVWLWDMITAYKANNGGTDPHFDAIGWNIYGCTNNPGCYDINGMEQYLIDRRQEAQNRGYNVPIWVLEYGGCLTNPTSPASDQAVMQAITTWFNQTSWIDRYAWYSNRNGTGFQGIHDCILIDDSNALTTLGQIYKPF